MLTVTAPIGHERIGSRGYPAAAVKLPALGEEDTNSECKPANARRQCLPAVKSSLKDPQTES
jgi:hypothetical protein